jgi:Protein of unknown function (DUF2795)
VERGSDKHGARMDDALAHEVEGTIEAGRSSRGEAWRDPEPSGEDQPDVDLRPDGALHGGVPDGMSEDDVELRSEVAQALGKEIYPASGAALLAKAQENSATDRVLDLLSRLPAEQTFTNVADLWTSLGGGVEQHRS